MTWEPLPDEVTAPRDLSSALGQLHRTMGLARPDTVRLLEHHWRSLMGPGLADSCELESVRAGELVVVASDPAVAEHLRWSARDLVAAVNELCDGTVVEDLVVKVRRR